MSNFKSDLITKKEAAPLQQSAGLVNGDDVSGTVLLATAIYQMTGDEVTGDTVELFDLPAGAVLVPQLSGVYTGADPGTTVAIDVGSAADPAVNGLDAIAADPDRYADGINVNAGGYASFVSAGFPAAADTPFRPRLPNRVIAKFDTISSLSGSPKLVFTIAYRVKG